MKNNRIVRAYDSINPSPAEKAKMLDAILAEANLEEKPTRERKKKNTVVYTAKATKPSKRSSFMAIAASLILLLISGLVLMRMVRQSDTVSYTQPEESTEELINVTVNFSYSPVLDKYRTALREGWSKEECEIEGISTRFYMPEPVDFTIGQRMLDINGDGKAELLIGHDDIIWDLYATLEDGTPIQLLSDEQDGWQYYICENRMILAEYYSKEDCYVEYYRLEGHELSLYQELQYQDGQWEYRLAGQDWEPMSEQDVQTLSNSYKHIQPDWIPLWYNDATSAYSETIYKYMRAADEGWDRSMCLENGMSELTPVGPDEGLYYAMFDLNGDGTEELIISEYPYRENTDTEFIDIYAMVDGVVRNVMSVKDEDMWSLCVHGYIKDISPAQRPEWDKYASYWQFQANHFVQQFAVGKKDNQWINEGYQGIGETITREEADEIVANYPPQKLDFQIIQSVPEESDTGFHAYDYIVSKYVEALTENWSKQQCEENDISPEIFADTTIRNDLGWCLLDLDSDGVEELIISDGITLFDVYVMQPHNGGPGHLISLVYDEYTYTDNYTLCKDGTIEHFQVSSQEGPSWRVWYRLAGIDLVVESVLCHRDNQYFYGASEQSMNPISKEEAGPIVTDKEKSAMELELTRFVEAEPFYPDAELYYRPLRELYQKALDENWDPPTCMENGMSLMVAHRGEYYDQLGYTIKDLDRDGVSELIITDGTNIYDLYTLVQDEEVTPVQLVSAMERIQYYLTTDGLVYNMGSGGAAVSYHTLYSLDGRELKLVKGYMMDADTDPDHPWFYYDGEKQLGKCPTAEAAAAMDAIVFEEIPFTPFK